MQLVLITDSTTLPLPVLQKNKKRGQTLHATCIRAENHDDACEKGREAQDTREGQEVNQAFRPPRPSGPPQRPASAVLSIVC